MLYIQRCRCKFRRANKFFSLLVRTGASRIFIFDHTIRRAPTDIRDVGGSRRGPATRVHIDQSYRGAESRVRHHLPEEADELFKKRFQIINVSAPPFPSPIPLSFLKKNL